MAGNLKSFAHRKRFAEGGEVVERETPPTPRRGFLDRILPTPKKDLSGYSDSARRGFPEKRPAGSGSEEGSRRMTKDIDKMQGLRRGGQVRGYAKGGDVDDSPARPGEIATTRFGNSRFAEPAYSTRDERGHRRAAAENATFRAQDSNGIDSYEKEAQNRGKTGEYTGASVRRYRRDYRTGGAVRGPGTTTSDSVDAKLSKKEFVVKASSAKKIGKPALNHINRTGTLPTATGADALRSFSSRPGGAPGRPFPRGSTGGSGGAGSY